MAATAGLLHEFAVLTLYGIIISGPYMRKVCGAGKKTRTYWLSLDMSLRQLSMVANGRTLMHIQATDGDLPHLLGVLVAFLKGALNGWEHFSSGILEDGAIAALSDIERVNGWMPSTNDMNEGMLGTFWVHQKLKPSTTQHQFNAKMMKELAYYKAKTVFEQCQKQAKTANATANRQKCLDSVELILDEAKIRTLTSKELDDQLDLHRWLVKGLTMKKDLKLKDDKFKVVIAELSIIVEAGVTFSGGKDAGAD
ncbi:hypothetical protein CONPUDRAFT_71616 [Coniophora puteana RWD-64-598 SS2]|uniref:Uncharacterized protein n=1 Tax=Coniophora puteana (strain RWD-64-598) TaxID=741705 RepID=A0A5M3MVC0_CONPW|nr:uncharacterized protein CONPUDRAFT_71616 [Coniophora puteana RWD-64-598 SS2]EIW82957.1 hypothetical protein CONPUDRAFT_71616 [Coniophora puteana RWD-64-598 SS2]